MQRFSIEDLIHPWSKRIRPYPPGKPIEEVERELGHPAIKLASNENPLGPSPKALEAIRASIERINVYPDGHGYYLRQRLAEIHGLDMNQIILGAGSTDLIELVAKAFLVAGDEAITSESAFYIYRLAIDEMGAGLVHVDKGGTSGEAGVGTARVGAEYQFPVDDADVRLGASLMGALVGPSSDEVKDLKAYGIFDVHVAVGF